MSDANFEKKRSITRIAMAAVTIISAFLILLALLALSPPASAEQVTFQVSHDEMLSVFEEFLAQHEIYSDVPHRLYSKRIMDSVSSESAIEIRIVDRKRNSLLKSDNFQVVLMSGGKTIRRFEMRVYIGIEVPVAVATRDIKRGEGLNDTKAYEFSWRDLSTSSVRMPVYQGDEIDSCVLKVNCGAGRELDRNLMEQPDIIHRNERVIVFFNHNGLMLTMIGKALESGKLHDRIKVLNETSRKTVVCEVTGDGEVEM